jgi:hypothetical protein
METTSDSATSTTTDTTINAITTTTTTTTAEGQKQQQQQQPLLSDNFPVCIASIDVGQTYISTVIGMRDICREMMCTSTSTSTTTNTNTLLPPRFEIVHFAIDEFAPFSAPHQPVNLKDNAALLDQAVRETKRLLRQQKQPSTTTTSTTTPPPPPPSKKSRKRERERQQQQQSSSSSPGSVQLSEMAVVRGAAECIKTYYHRYGIDFVVIEDQLPTVRRNRVVQSALVAACHALGIPVVSIAPGMKFLFASKTLQDAYRKCEREKGSTLKTISVRLFETVALVEQEEKATTTTTTTTDMALLDLKAFDRKNLYDCINPWYKKDLTDSFWQLVAAFKLDFDKLSRDAHLRDD